MKCRAVLCRIDLSAVTPQFFHNIFRLSACTGYRLSQNGVNFVQDATAVYTFGKTAARIALFAGALYEITDFKIESVFKYALFCNIFHGLEYFFCVKG